MPDFRPRQGPEFADPDLRSVVKWVEGELQRLARSGTEAELVPFREHHVAIERPREGMLVRADGTDWDPGEGQGLYQRIGGVWEKLGGALADGDYGDISISSGVWSIDDNAVTNTELANMAEATVKLRAAGAGTGDPIDGTADQLWTIVQTATTLAVPNSKMTFSAGSGDEGGQFQLEQAPNSTLDGLNVNVDQYIDRVRFFESGGSARGFYLDILYGSAGATSRLAKCERVSGGGSVGTGTTFVISNIPKHDVALLQVLDLSHNSGAAQTFRVELSSDNGSSYNATTFSIDVTARAGTINVTETVWITHDGSYNYQLTRGGATTGVNASQIALGAQVNAIRLSPSGGSFDAGRAFLTVF